MATLPPAAPEARLSRRRRILFGATTTALGLLAVFGAGELIARVHYYGRFPEMSVPHPSRGHANRPGWEGYEGKPRRGIWTRFNSLGLRQPGELEREGSRPRVLVIGDSVAFGYRLPDEACISARLEAALGRAGREVECVNAGCYGYGVQDAGAWLGELEDLGLRADAVLLVICYNDFGQTETAPVEMPPAWLAWLEAHSALVMALGRKIHQVERSLNDPLTEAQIEGRFVVEPEAAAQAARQVAYHIACTSVTAELMGGELAVAFWPGEDQVAAFRETGRRPPTFEALKDILAKEQASIPVFDALELLAEGLERAPMFMDHCHPSEEGAAALAERLAPWLETQALED